MRHFGVKMKIPSPFEKKLGFYFHFFLRLHVLMDSVNKNPCQVRYPLIKKLFNLF